MKITIKAITTVILTITVTACMNSPKGEKVDAKDVYTISKSGKGEIFSAVKNESNIQWLGTKPTGTHSGTVRLINGNVSVENDQITGGSIKINMQSITCSDIENPEMNTKLVSHLLSTDFFAVDSFPTATFEIARIEELVNPMPNTNIFEPTHTVMGNLTLRGRTKGISFPARIEITNELLRVTTPQFYINRTHWGVNYGSKSIFMNLADNFIHDEMGLTINFTAKK
ncbi:MAG TPA: YceI family protein [Tenuifilaceae bacterium]|nr:YceI family protein [Tenuifilaceae bacterium]HPE19095.1 YceI family protein [Tenuifilaceae bacterium]HPJ46604.1 YceI family protein [Tenuifilaceae bacterium]HPQ34960.1 YceI family protein [Tenuifilaceae bacterium]HRX68762.1 YceI family protein [Tenuifilaceae bacterium]